MLRLWLIKPTSSLLQRSWFDRVLLRFALWSPVLNSSPSLFLSPLLPLPLIQSLYLPPLPASLFPSLRLISDAFPGILFWICYRYLHLTSLRQSCGTIYVLSDWYLMLTIFWHISLRTINKYLYTVHMDQSFIHLYHLSAVAVLANRSPRKSVTVSAAAGSNLARINCILNCLNQRGECF